MDKYIKMLTIQLSEKYHVTVTVIMVSGKEKGKIGNIIKFKLMNKEQSKILYSTNCASKRGLVVEMAKWLDD